MSASASLPAAVFASSSGACAPTTRSEAQGGRLPRPPPPSSSSSTFKLRPRSKSLHHSVAGFSDTTNDISPIKPHWLQAHAISPDGPMFPSSTSSTSSTASTGGVGGGFPTDSTAATILHPLTFASMFASGNDNKNKNNNSSSPIKKQKIQEDEFQQLHHLRRQHQEPSSPDSSLSCTTEANINHNNDSPLVKASSSPAKAPLFTTTTTTAAVEYPSSPTNNDQGASSKNRNNGSSTVTSEESSPFTPQGRQMMQKLCINPSASPSLAFPTPEKKSDGGGAGSQLVPNHQILPTMPTFSFSPSLKLDREDITTTSRNNNITNTSTTTDYSSSIRETIAYSVGGGGGSTSTPQGTPNRGSICCPRTTTTSASGASSTSCYSPFHSSSHHSNLMRGQMTPIGQQRGSVFKMLPPRLYPMGRDRDDNMTESSLGTTSSVNNETNTPTPWSTCSSLNSTTMSPSPRLVPLTVLSRNSSTIGSSPATALPKILLGPSNTYPVAEPSPLMLSQDGSRASSSSRHHTTTNHEGQYLPSPRLSDIEIPNISKALLQESPLSNGSSSNTSNRRHHHQYLPRIKLTPRGMYNFAPIGRDTSCEEVSSTTGRSGHVDHHHHNQASSSLLYSPEDKEAAEMDSLLNGFELRTKSSNPPDNNMAVDRTTHQEHHPSTTSTDSLNRVESEEAEMVALTQGLCKHYYHSSSLDRHRLRRNYLSVAEEEEEDSDRKNYDKKPMSSITLNMGPSSLHHPSDASASASLHSTTATASPSFLPRPVPMDHTTSRSLFDNSRNSYERILLADAIAEAARSNEPLTDDEDIDGDSDFLLCLPRDTTRRHNNNNNGKGSRHNSKSSTMGYTERQASSSLRPSSASVVRAGSPMYYGSDTLPTMKVRKGIVSRRKSIDQGLPSLSSQTTLTIYEDCAAAARLKTSSSNSKRPLFEGGGLMLMKHGASEATFGTYCSLSDCDTSEVMTSPKYNNFKMKAALGVTKDRHSVCSLLSMSSLCGLDIVHEASQSGELDVSTSDKILSVLSSESQDFSANLFRPLPLTRSEFSMNSLGLSLDSMDAGVESSTRDLFTPPMMMMSAQNCKRMLSPPPLRHRPNSLYQSWK